MALLCERGQQSVPLHRLGLTASGSTWLEEAMADAGDLPAAVIQWTVAPVVPVVFQSAGDTKRTPGFDIPLGVLKSTGVMPRRRLNATLRAKALA